MNENQIALSWFLKVESRLFLKPTFTTLELTLNTPALLFPALTLIMLAYTNRFLALGSLIRNLYQQYEANHDELTLIQIRHLKHRLRLIRDMQVLGVLSLTACVFTMGFIYLESPAAAKFLFAASLLLLAGSLIVSVYEILISTRALNMQLRNLEEEKKGFLGTKLFSK